MSVDLNSVVIASGALSITYNTWAARRAAKKTHQVVVEAKEQVAEVAEEIKSPNGSTTADNVVDIHHKMELVEEKLDINSTNTKELIRLIVVHMSDGHGGR